MAISEYSNGPERKRIGLIGYTNQNDLENELKIRNYECLPLDEDELGKPDKIVLIDSVVFLGDKTEKINGFLSNYGATLLNNDCRIYIRLVPSNDGPRINTLRNMAITSINNFKLPPSGLSETEQNKIGDWYEGPALVTLSPYVHLCEKSRDCNGIANAIRSNPAGPAANLNLKISARNSNNKNMALSSEDKLLVQRSFWDCDSAHLVKIQDGLSDGVNTFRAYVNRSDSPAGPLSPYLYFIKLGGRKIISTEYRQYQALALQYIPFHLGPRLVMDRCALGQSRGILVCDYVRGAEALRDCAKDGRAAPAISNLFNTTITAWHRNAVKKECSLKHELEKKFPEKIPEHRKDLINKFGATKLPTELMDMFKDIDELVSHGVVHGDLHATNVLVRSNDAIIIDFEKMEESFPLLYDAASVEAGLFVDGFIRDNRTGKQLLASVSCLYEKDAFDEKCPPCQTGDAAEWFFDCVHQIRMHARELELAPFQYARTLGVVLLKKSCSKIYFKKRARDRGLSKEDLRALAYVLGEHLIMSITN